MSKKYSSWTSNQLLASIDTELITMKLISVKGDKQNQFKNLETVEVNSSMSSNLDASPLVSTTVPTSLTNKQITVLPAENLLKATSSTSKQNHKHKHHHCHRHHHHHHCHRVKKTIQQPRTVYLEASNNKSHAVHKKTSANVSNEIDNGTTSVDDHETPPIVYSQDQAIKSNKGNIPLQSIENKLVSQRVASTDETQVGNCSSIIYTQPTSSILNTDGLQQIEQIIYTDDCCLPSSTINCASNSCILQQPESICCLPQQQQQQQQQQQLFLCTDPTSMQDFICSSSATMQPTIISQMPVFNASSANLSSQQFICISEPSVQPSASIIIQQQPQIQAQPIQIIQAPQTQPAQYLQISSATPQIIQTIQAPAGQNQQAQPIIQAFQANPQILYQRPYDPMVIPIQNQQLAIARTPMVALSQPSYAPARLISAAPARQTAPGPRMFQHALVRTVANRVGVPLLSVNTGGLQSVPPPPMINAPRGTGLASTARALLNDAAQPSTSLPIIPLTAGGLLIPFRPSEPPKGMMHGTLPRTTGYPTSLRNYDTIRRQIQQRAQLLAELQRQNSGRIPSLPVHSTNAASSSLPSPIFPRYMPRSAPGPSSNIPISPSVFSSNIPRSPSIISSNIPQPPPIIRSQTPYTRGNTFGTSSSSSSSSSSKSSTSSILPMPTTQATPSNLAYAAPSSSNARGESTVSAPYQLVRP